MAVIRTSTGTVQEVATEDGPMLTAAGSLQYGLVDDPVTGAVLIPGADTYFYQTPGGGLQEVTPSAGGRVPAWVERAPDGTLPLWHADYANGRYWLNGVIYPDRASFITAALASIVADGAADGTLVLWLTTPATGGVGQLYWNLSDGTLNNRVSQSRASARVANFTVVNATVAVANIGGGSQPDSTAVRTACGWAANDFLSVSDGTIATDTSGAVPTGFTTLARFAGYESLFSKEVFWPQKFANDAIRQMAEPDNALISYGDSNTQSVTNLGSASGRYAYNGGIGGETSTQVLARYIAALYRHNKALIWEAGRNDIYAGASVEQVLANAASAVATQKNGKFIVCSILPDPSDTPEMKSKIAQIHATWSALYGSKYHDELAVLVANATSPGDDASVAAGFIPNSLYSSGPHCTLTGYNLLGVARWTKAQALGF